MFKPTTAKTHEQYIDAIPEPRKSAIQFLHEFIQKHAPKLKPYIQAGMLGYGSYHYKYASGREGDWAIIGLASQKNYISMYLSCVSVDGGYIAQKYNKELGKVNVGKSCIRFKNLEDLNLKTLEKAIKEAVKNYKE